MTDEARGLTSEFYGPLAGEGAGLLERYSEGQLKAFRGQLAAATGLIERHRAGIRAESK